MPTEIEKEMCDLCAYKRRFVLVTDGDGGKKSVACGSAKNPHCPGFVPGNLGRPEL